jgi:urease subunit alpha
VASALHFVSAAAVDDAIHHRLDLGRELCAVKNTRGIGKAAMIHNGATPVVEVDAETYEVRADGTLLTCAPAEILPMAQRYFLF